MAIDPLSLTLMAVNVGTSVFNNKRNNKLSRELREKQEKYARAAADRDKQRMWQLMREGQELSLELEREIHESRLKDIEQDFARTLYRLTFAQAIKTWPLKVLPIVMKNQSLGSLDSVAAENIAMHCILTPSNCMAFNKYIFPIIEGKLADFLNLHWNTLSSHPILFYSGAWKTGTEPTGVEVEHLKTNLSNLPFLLITPFFKPEGGLEFQLKAWGMGVDFDNEIECSDFSYADSYKSGIDYQLEEDIKDCTIEEVLSFLQCLVGYIADQYFWTAYSKAPLLPTLLAMKIVNIDGMPYLSEISKDRYENLLNVSVEEIIKFPFLPCKILSLIEGCTTFWNNETRKDKLEDIFIANVQGICKDNIISMKEALSYEFYSKESLSFIRRFIDLYQYKDYKEELVNLLKVLESIDFDYSILELTDIVSLERLADGGNSVAMFRLGEIYEYSIGVKWDEDLSMQYYKHSADLNFILAKLKCNATLYALYETQVECLINMGLSQALLAKIEKLCASKKEDVALLLCKNGDNNHPGISYNIANILIKEQKDPSLIEKLLSNSADLGYIKAQELLCKLYKEGDIIKENPQKHALYAEKGMLQNSPYATYAMALCYINGYGEKQSTNAGMMLIDKAEKLKWPDAIRIKTLLNTI